MTGSFPTWDTMRALEAERDDQRAAKVIAARCADRLRDLVCEVLELDENPGDDALVEQLRAHFGKTGPERTKWRDDWGYL